MLPLPKGEGWGEGEGTANQPRIHDVALHFQQQELSRHTRFSVTFSSAERQIFYRQTRFLLN
jgi:hypothetical protein